MRSLIMLEPAVWSEKQFDACEFGDTRSTQRLVLYVQQMAEKPDASTPHQTENRGHCKAVYRLFERPENTFESVNAAYSPNTRTLPPGALYGRQRYNRNCLWLRERTKGTRAGGIGRSPRESHTSSANDQYGGRI